MGDPKKLTKKYSRPLQMWNKTRVEEDGKLFRKYALKNRKEVWRMRSLLRNLQGQAKKLTRSNTEQAKKEEEQLLARLNRIGLLDKEATLNTILGLHVENLMERRLQTLVFKKQLANSMKQSRQFVTHRHITVSSKKVTIPSYLVLRDEEEKISFSPFSDMANVEHPERIKPPKPITHERKRKQVNRMRR